MGRPCDGHAVIGFLDFRSLYGPSVPAQFMLHLLKAAVGQTRKKSVRGACVRMSAESRHSGPLAAINIVMPCKR